MQGKPHRLAINDTNYCKYVWNDGTTYEFKIKEWSTLHKESNVYINGKLVYTFTE
jgi:hypothetical protein